MTVQAGYEAAAWPRHLGDDLQAPLDEASPHHWRDLGDLDACPPLPVGCKPLSDFVQAPPAPGAAPVHDRRGISSTRAPALQGIVAASASGWSTWRGAICGAGDGYAASADAPVTGRHRACRSAIGAMAVLEKKN